MSQYDEIESDSKDVEYEEGSPLTEQQQSTTVLGALIIVIGTMPIAIVGFILSIIALKWIKDVDHPGYARIKGVTKVLAIISIVLQSLMILFFAGYFILIILIAVFFGETMM
ncbi:hypothetical protein [Alkalicoccobacillus plakortidis]|uniref:DUF4190 domain-containing protein n=1 Tax=Alkalicoccobacillus plakortidis TaxID=444060 RepID=A0ABT0XJ68_9BACI|nr:hypothetical protein [Alkalicoccobacillus plakortidis]MCM2675795.1 hypothetical protein [Alkalicoccobacillus plakortidis]